MARTHFMESGEKWTPREITEWHLNELECLIGGFGSVFDHLGGPNNFRSTAHGLLIMIEDKVQAVRSAHEAETATTAAE